jgi:hypothetical protein
LLRIGRLVPGLRGQRTLQRLELFEQVMSVAIPPALLLLEQAQHDALGHWVAVFVDRARAWRGPGPLQLEQRVSISGTERELAGDHLEEEDAQRIQVGLRPSGFASRLFGRHVLGRAEHRALGR